MSKRLLILIFIAGIIALFHPGVFADDGSVLIAKIVEAGEMKEDEGLCYQNVRVEILKGEYKGIVSEVQVPFESNLERQLQIGDRIKIQTIEVNDDTYFQFYDFSRSKNYIWLVLLYIIIVTAFLGLRGLKTLIPSLCMVFLIIVGLVPILISNVDPVILSLSLIGILAGFTAWIRLKHKLLAVIVLFSVVLCLFLGYLVFAGFANISYIEPFLGTITAITDEINKQILDIVYISAFFIPAGGVINASIQVSKYLLDNFGKAEKSDLAKMLKGGLKLSQKISAGEMNNLIFMIIGFSLASIFIIKESSNDLRFWDHGWISLQLIYLVSSGISILLITPITVFITAGFLKLTNRKHKGKGGQQKLNIKKAVQQTTRRFKYFK